jgi:hypothetical protein
VRPVSSRYDGLCNSSRPNKIGCTRFQPSGFFAFSACVPRPRRFSEVQHRALPDGLAAPLAHVAQEIKVGLGSEALFTSSRPVRLMDYVTDKPAKSNLS